MSEKRKSTPKAKVLTAVLLVLFLGSCAVLIFAICTDVLGINSNINPTETVALAETTAVNETATAGTEATEPSSEAVSTTASEAITSDVTLGSAYEVDYWVEYKAENGSSGLGVLFGAHNTGAAVSFEGQRFVVSATGNGTSSEIATGTFSLVSDTELELRYDNSYIATATVLETENGTATEIDFPLDVEGTTLRASLSR